MKTFTKTDINYVARRIEKSEILSLWDGATNEQPSVSYGLLSTPRKLNLIRNGFKYTDVYGSRKSDMLLLLPGLDAYVGCDLGKGNDFAIGASGENRFFGKGGRDVLIGGAGSEAENHLSGGPGKDLIISKKHDSCIFVISSHGDEDGVVTYKRGQLTSEIVSSLVKDHKFVTYPGMMHEATEEELMDIKTWMSEKLK